MSSSLFKRSCAVAVILLFIGMSVVPSTAVQESKEKPFPINFDGNTLYVGGSGPNNYSTIQIAIDDAVDGDTVFVYDDSSPYYESIVIDKSINLIGEEKNTTVIDGEKRGDVIKTAADGIVVSGFTVRHGGIYICSNDNHILGNIITDSGKGFRIENHGSNNIVEGNRIVHNSYGIYIYDLYETCDNNLFTENFIAHNPIAGIWDYDRKGGTIVTWNVIADNGIEGHSQINYGVFKKDSYSIYHHNDLFFNSRNVRVDGGRLGNDWDDGSEGNYWDDWESNPGYPDVYIIPSDLSEEIDWHPHVTPYFDSIVISLHYEYFAEVDEPIYFWRKTNVNPYNVTWYWEFGDGITSDEMYPEHPYNKTGVYFVNVTITDDQGRSDTAKCRAVIGLPPELPTIDGPTTGLIGVFYNYTFVSIDPDGDDIIYHIWWGDMWTEDAGPYPSGEEITLSHEWMWEDTYYISVIAEDNTTGLLSPEAWLEVTMPINQHSYSFPLLQRLLERLPNAFPILRHLMGL